MSGSLSALLSGCIVLLCAGCDGSAVTSDVGARFVAANSSTVIIDMAPNSAADLTQARAMATEKCALFGGSGAVLESLNLIANNRERASFLCR